MKPIYPLTFACLSLLLASGCTRPSASASGYSSGPDRTKGMTSSRIWKVHSVGYAKGDTIPNPTDSVKVEWPKKFDRKVDTLLSASWINNLTIAFATVQLQYRTDDGVTRVFDTSSKGTTLRTSLTYTIADSSMIYIYHSIDGKNNATGIYYTTDDTFKTK